MLIQHLSKGGLILHSDQGSQYTSKAFIEFCESVHIIQSRSKAGYPYDNAPMERYFNTLKNECTNLYEFRTEEDSYTSVTKKVTKTKSVFLSDAALEKMLYLASENLVKKWTQRYRNWDQVLNQLIVLYGEQLTQYL